jgi:HK97 family phage portal protein
MGKIATFLANAFGMKQSTLSILPEFALWPTARTGHGTSPLASLQVSTVMGCVRTIAEGVAQTLPIRFYEADSKGRLVRRRGHPLDTLINKRPNPYQNAFEFWESLVAHAALAGNAYVYLSRVGTAREIRELLLIPPDRCGVEVQLDGSLRYRITLQDGSQLFLSSQDVWHIRGLSWDTYIGLEAVKTAREAIGLAMSTEETHARLHVNGINASGIYTFPGTLTPDQYNKLRDWLVQMTTGDNHSKPLLLDRGATFTPTSITGVDAQHLETRKFQIEEICRHFRVLPIMLGYSDKTATYASAEQMFISHVVHTLSPWYRRLEMSLEVSVLGIEGGVEVKFWDKSLLRGAARDRAEYISRALGAGGAPSWWTQNDAREEDGLDPIDDAKYDELPQAANMQAEKPEPKPKEGAE